MPIEAWWTCSYLLCLLDKRNLRKDYSSNGCFIFYKRFHGKDNCCLEVFPLNLVSYLGVYVYSNYRPEGKPQNLLQNILQKKRCFCTLSPATALTQLPACVLSLLTFKYRAWASTVRWRAIHLCTQQAQCGCKTVADGNASVCLYKCSLLYKYKTAESQTRSPSLGLW